MEIKSARTGVENNVSVRASYQKRRYRAALHKVAVLHTPIATGLAAFSHKCRVVKKKRLRSFSSGAAGVIAPELLWPRRGCWFFCVLFSSFRLAVGLALIGWGRRATLRRLLRLLALL
jgi:hypothetical protein